MYAELHCHSYYSFLDGASSLEELILKAKELGYTALALTDHNNLCGAMSFARLCKSLGIKGIIGAEITLEGSYHLTLLAKDSQGYSNLCRFITEAYRQGDRRQPELPREYLAEHTEGLIALSGCTKGKLAELVNSHKSDEAARLIKEYQEWFGVENYFIEIQSNLVYGDVGRNRTLYQLSAQTGAKLVATGNVHYHQRERHQLQDCLVAIRHCQTLEESHRVRRPNSEFYLRTLDELKEAFKDYPQALENTLSIAAKCDFDLATASGYSFPEYQTENGKSPDEYLEEICNQAALRRYGTVSPQVEFRLREELRLVKKHRLAGFLLLYHDVAKLGREVMVDLGLSSADLPLEENPPGRGRGSSVSLLIGYLIGISHIDPLEFGLSLERFMPEDSLSCAPDIDLDFPRSIREELILRTHEKWGWRYAALTGTIGTYQIRGAVRDLGKVLDLPAEELVQLSAQLEWGSARKLEKVMEKLPQFKEKLDSSGWCDLLRLSWELDGFPKYLGQHPGGMIISSTPISDVVPIQPAATPGRYICQWDKDSIDDAGFVKIDFLALGALSQIQECTGLIYERIGAMPDMSRIDYNDQKVYDMLCRGDTIGIFQVESAAQMQTIVRLKPRNLFDMAHEVGAVRPGVGVNGGVQEYLARRCGKKPVIFDHPLEKHALERTLGIVLFQDQVNQLAIDVAGFKPAEADQLRRAFSRRHNQALLEDYRSRFLAGALARGVDEETAGVIFSKFNGQYMFPESHAFAFGVTAYQASWLKLYYPLEFFTAIFNQQPMGFYNLETLKEDAKRHGIKILNPDVNKSDRLCLIENGAVRLGLLMVSGLGEAAASAITETRTEKGNYKSIGDFLERSGVLEEVALNLASAGAFDCFELNRRKVKWEIGLRYRPANCQLSLPLPVEQDLAALVPPGNWDKMIDEYSNLGLYPTGHIMASLRHKLGKGICTSKDMDKMKDGDYLSTAGLVIRRQRPRGKVVFLTLEDEFGHIPCMVFPGIYQQSELTFKKPFLIVSGYLSRKDGACNLVIQKVKSLDIKEKVTVSRDWK
ncbi:Error-prone repair-like of DNA polymerase III alpha subunit [Dehalococcoides mccartyi]|uniref:DNA polymerase III subunit alpha n=1 Tax=Dehalococcoides mccartyi TaxID=61435 RepID=UPI0015E63D44|nr:DNA polymerase III subunit alpha [Dehalococcoides mccartyi]MBA2084217.1 Error-prone repair-like of DNA polymerase III alpha subunit [Dehalococcoides mccartyi]